jgi:uroporphyrinogen decarboxylase
MNDRERSLAILDYKPYDRMPIVHFGFWNETLELWHEKGLVSAEEAKNGARDHSPEQKAVCARLGFDYGWSNCRCFPCGLFPAFAPEVVEEMPDGSKKIRNGEGVLELHVPGVRSIPTEFDHLLKDRASYELHFKKRLQPTGRVRPEAIGQWLEERAASQAPFGIFLGSMMGSFRNWIGVENLAYLALDDETLFKEIVDSIGTVVYETARETLELAAAKGLKFDYGHYWEDICYKSGPLVNPTLFDELCGPHYKRVSELLKSHGIELVSLDCDGCIDALIPTWLKNGVNTMFPIEVGTWNASLAPWREKYGRQIRGVGGMDKKIFALDKAAVDAEIERLKPIVELGGFIPCPDHRIPPDAKWELVQYYCERMRKTF